MSKIDKSKIKAFSYINTIDQILKQSINNLQIDYFYYSRVFNNNTRIILSSENLWFETFVTQHYSIGMTSSPYKLYKPGYVLWPFDGKEMVYNIMVNDYNICNQITYVLKDKDNDYCELFTYATNNLRKPMHNIYINNLDMIHTLSLQLKEKILKIISDTDTDKYYNPQNTLYSNKNKIDLTTSSHQNINCLLTSRELEILKYLALGYTAKKTAAILQISYRTVETHVEHLKKKLNCFYKYELIKIAINMGLIVSCQP